MVDTNITVKEKTIKIRSVKKFYADVLQEVDKLSKVLIT